MDHLHRLQGCILPHSNTETVQEISEISCPRTNLPIQSPTIRAFDSTTGIYCSSKGGQTDGHTQGYKDPPVPRRLVGESQILSSLSPTHTRTSTDMPEVRLDSKLGKIRTGAQTDLQFRRLPVRSEGRPGPAYTGPVADPPRENLGDHVSTDLSGPAVHVPDWSANSNRKQVYLGRLHMRPIQWHLKNNWRVPEALEKIIPVPRSLHPHLEWWLDESNLLQGQPLHPLKHALQIFTDASKEGWGAHLGEHTARGSWSVPESKLHINFLELKAVFLALKGFQHLCTARIVLVATDNTTLVAYINKEGGMRSGPLCALLWRILTWCTNHQITLKAWHIPGHLNVIADKLSRLGQTRVVPPSGSFPTNMQPMAPASNRSFCHEVQPQVTSVCLSSIGLPGCCSGCTYSAMGRSGCIRLLTDRHIGQSGGEATGLPVQETHSDCPGVAQHALVLGPGDHVQSGPCQPAQPAQVTHTTLQSDPSQKSDKSKSPCLAPRATKFKEQGCSETVAARIEAPQRRSTRSVYEARWTIFTKWCITNQVDLRSPPVKSVADFLRYLFEDKKLQPSTIDGYRSAIADKLGDTSVNISKDENLTRLLESFHRDRPKGRRGCL